MRESELIEFLDNYEYQVPFLRIKKIYELTNNLDLYLLKALRTEFRRHYVKKAFQLVKDFETGVTGDYDYKYYLGADLIILYNSEREIEDKIDVTIDTLDNIVWSLSEKDFDLAEIIIEGMADFLYEIDELIRYKGKNVIKNSDSTEIEDELIDYSESNYSSKIIFLEKLGVIQYLTDKSPFSNSTNSLANALSGVTGIKPTTIQPMLNAMLNKGTSDKNNPLKSTKTVNVVINKLTNIGYKVE